MAGRDQREAGEVPEAVARRSARGSPAGVQRRGLGAGEPGRSGRRDGAEVEFVEFAHGTQVRGPRRGGGSRHCQWPAA